MKSGNGSRSSATSISADKLADDVKSVAREAEDLLEATASQATEQTRAIRDRLAAALDSAKETSKEIQAQAKRGIKATDEFVHENPYQSMGIAFGVGLLIGFLIKRK